MKSGKIFNLPNSERARDAREPKGEPELQHGLAPWADGRWCRSNRKARPHKVSIVSTPLLAELAASPMTPPPMQEGRALLEAGVLAYRRQKHRDIEILLISKKRTKRWGIPKGRAEPHLNFSEIAAQEAFEEAGVIGYVSTSSVGMFRAKKQLKDRGGHQIIEVWVYLFEVTKTRAKWPEKHKREIKWVSCQVAAQELREPLLAHLCHRLAQCA
jgi:8-oxo-dGTP pyrophosphatase MutT (NUDIX family)